MPHISPARLDLDSCCVHYNSADVQTRRCGLCLILRQYVSTCYCSMLRHCYLKMSFATLLHCVQLSSEEGKCADSERVMLSDLVNCGIFY